MKIKLSDVRSCQGGFAATEFALIIPFLLVIFFGILEASSALGANRRTTVAAATLADLVAQESEISTSSLDDLISGVRQVAGIGASTISFEVVSAVYDPDQDKAVVGWSRNSSHGTPISAGEVLSGPNASVVVATKSSLIIVRAENEQKSMLTKYFIPEQTLVATTSRLPRRAISVTLCPTTCK